MVLQAALEARTGAVKIVARGHLHADAGEAWSVEHNSGRERSRLYGRFSPVSGRYVKDFSIVKLPISLSARLLRDTKTRTKERVEREQRSTSTERGKNKRRTASGPVGR